MSLQGASPGQAADRGSLSWEQNVDGVCSLPLRVEEPIDWELDESGERIGIWMDRSDRRTWYRARVKPVLEGLEAGESLPEIVDRFADRGTYASRERAHRVARRLVAGLADQGNVEVVFPPLPEAFQDRYERRKLLGGGGTGLAWLCHDREEECEVVVKHAWNWSGELWGNDERIRRETSLMARLDHPRIVAHRDSFEIEGRFHLVRDFVDGEELSQRVLREEPPPLPVRRRILGSIAGILEHMHEREVLCLDAKPSNFMVEEDWHRPVLADVGHSARAPGGEVDLGKVVGTPRFVAPETREDKRATIRSDVYGLGCLAVALITERAPPPVGLGDRLFERLEDNEASEAELGFVRACMEGDPSRRPASPSQAVEILSEP